MKLFDWLNSTISTFKNGFESTRSGANSFNDDNQNRVNPASSLPMNGSVDIHGNPFGSGGSISHDPFADINRHHHNDFNNHTSSLNDYHNHHHDTFNNAFSHNDYNDPFRNY